MATQKKKRSFRSNKNQDFRKRESTDSKELAREKYNDPSWYTASGQLARDVASFSFNNALGAPSTIVYDTNGTLEANSLVYRAPGIMGIYTAPSFGYSNGGHSALNLAAKNFYAWIRHANSGHANYDSPDLMLYLGAMDSIYAAIAYFMRAYGVARVYSQVNRYIGDSLLKAMGLDPVDVRTNLAQLRGFINMYITKASAFVTPNTMTMFKRHYWMFSGVYKDEPVTKSQMYMYCPAVLWKYVETDGAGHLDAIPWCTLHDTNGFWQVSNRSFTLADMYVKANQLLDALVNSEDINIMSGDILKAYGDNIWRLSLVPEDYAVAPVYSEEVLDQIHNTMFCGRTPTATLDLSTNPSSSLTRLGVFQDASVGDGALMFMPQFSNAWHLGYDAILDMHYESPTPEQVLVASRNMVHGHTSLTTASSPVAVTDIESCGSDLCLWAEVIKLADNEQGISTEQMYVTANANSTSFAKVELLSQFNKYPIFYRIGNTAGSPAVGIMGEIDNYTVISADDLSRLHDSSVLSLLGVPFLGTAAK